MRLTIIGCAGSFPGPDSPASCYLVEAEHDGGTFRLLVDLGNGALGNLQNYVDLDQVDAVALSHLHADHCLDMCGYYVVRRYHPNGPMPKIPVYGPASAPAHLARAYDLDPDPGMSGQFDFRAWEPGTTVELGPFAIEVIVVDHPVEAYALKIVADGRTLVYSGDTGPFDGLTEFTRDADVFLAEASWLEGRDNPPHLHMTGADAGRIAHEVDLERLLLTHVPPWHDPKQVLADAQSAFGGSVDVVATGADYQV